MDLVIDFEPIKVLHYVTAVLCQLSRYRSNIFRVVVQLKTQQALQAVDGISIAVCVLTLEVAEKGWKVVAKRDWPHEH